MSTDIHKSNCNMPYQPINSYLPREDLIFQINCRYAYCDKARKIGALEHTFTQIRGHGCGFFARVAQMSEVSLASYEKDFSSVEYTEVSEGHIAFVLPLGYRGDLKVNGVGIREDCFFSYPPGVVVTSGGPRSILWATLPRDRVLHSIARLQESALDDCALPEGALLLPDLAVRRLKVRLGAMLDNLSAKLPNALDPVESTVLSRQLFDLLLDYLLCAREAAEGQQRGILPPVEIVRRTEECFLNAQGRRLSLADFCDAAGVSAGTLTAAFRVVTGLTPARYFKLRRFSQAHELLERNAFERSPVKQAALSVGLTDLGRFSVEYRKLFGHSPSETASAGHA